MPTPPSPTTKVRIQGSLQLPGDKSISHRALIFSALGHTNTTITGLSTGQDVASTASCLSQLGVTIKPIDETSVHVNGINGQFKNPEKTLDCGNSGTTTRLLLGLLSGMGINATLEGDESLNKRPMKRATQPLEQMGAQLKFLNQADRLPIQIEPAIKGLTGIDYILPMASAQVKSAILLAGLCAPKGSVSVTEALPTRDHTERILNALGCKVEKQTLANEHSRLTLMGGIQDFIIPSHWLVPGDISSATFLMVAAAILPHSELTLTNVSLNPSRTPVIELLRQVGVTIEATLKGESAGEPYGDITLSSPETLQGNLTITPQLAPLVIDEIPALTILGLFTQGTMTVTGAEELRHKECDRLQAILDILSALNIPTTISADGYTFTGNPQLPLPESLKQHVFETHHDHRIVMSLEVLNLRIPFKLNILGQEWVKISYPGFYQHLNQLLKTL
jgi:3-phosphoshikimate 1-carboxyvinyltransferase